MEQSSRLVAYFASQPSAADVRSVSKINLSLVIASTLPGILGKLCRPDEWALTAVAGDLQIKEQAEALQEAGIARAVLVIPEATAALSQAASLKQRLVRSTVVLEKVWQEQSREADPDRPGVRSAEWGIAEEAFEEAPEALSIIEHYYVLESAVERLSDHIGARQKLPLNEKAYQLGVLCLDGVGKKFDETQFRRSVRRQIVQADYSLRVLENLQFMIELHLLEVVADILTGQRQAESYAEAAEYAADYLYQLPEQDRLGLVAVLSQESISDSLALEIIERLSELTDARIILAEKWLGLAADAINNASKSHLKQKDARLNRFKWSIIGLRLLARIDWADFLEQVDPITAILRQDPLVRHDDQASETRRAYRAAVAEVAEWSGVTERRAVEVAASLAWHGPRSQHIGSYLLGCSRSELETRLGVRLPWRVRTYRWMEAHPGRVYVGIQLVVGLVVLAVILAVLRPWLNWGLISVVILGLFLLPLSKWVSDQVNRWMGRIIPARFLPELSYENGLRKEVKACVIVPTLLSSEQAIAEDVSSLELRYLANPEPLLAYGILADYTDSGTSETPEQRALLDFAIDQFAQISSRHPAARFFLYHRPNSFNPTEGVWMAKERKRGKVEDFFGFVLGKSHEGTLVFGEDRWLENANFAICLDADTELPPGAAGRLIGAMAHPLNRPTVGRHGRRHGYGIIQPAVQTNYESTIASKLSLLLNGTPGIDPYMSRFTDLYFDLSDDAIYYGKGIIDINFFYNQLAGRFPDNRILSHDLLEGAHVGVGMATTIRLFDAFPDKLSALEARQQRWIRGDWQIAAWISQMVPSAGGQAVNQLNFLSRYKIADNLRRSLYEPATLLYLLIGLVVRGQALTLVLWLFGLQMVVLPVLEIVRLGIQRRDNRLWLLSILDIAVLPYRAFRHTDAIARALWRLCVSRRYLLQWRTAAEQSKLAKSADIWFLPGMLLACAFAALTPVGLELAGAGVFVVLWMGAPLLNLWLEQPVVRLSPRLSAADTRYARQLALQTWRYFDEFMTSENNYLPPDNYQVALRRQLITRTSPTNIGLAIAVWPEAVRFGFVTIREALSRTSQSLHAIQSLESYRGHLYNWYDIKTLEPLPPRFVSTVDSGNLVASLWTYRQAIASWREWQPGSRDLGLGLEEVLAACLEASAEIDRSLRQELRHLIRGVNAETQFGAYIRSLSQACRTILAREELLAAAGLQDSYQLQRLVNQAKAITAEIHDFLDWALVGEAEPAALLQLAAGTRSDKAKQSAEKLLAQLDESVQLAGELSDRVDFGFLYNPKRRVFHIGFDRETEVLNPSFYDLLASEARTASFIAIATGQIPVRHWRSLSRAHRFIDRKPSLLSWSGTMFEYLMPRLFMRSYPGTLLDQALDQAVRVQMAMGKRLQIPWGISESAHSDLDVFNTYQYRAFGAQPLAVQYSREHDIVIAPYASFLAAQVAPVEAIANLRELERIGARGAYGFIESLDYRRPHRPSGDRGVGIYTYMAHHLGMSLLALSNIVHSDAVVNTFHADLRVEAARTLLQESLLSRRRGRKRSVSLDSIRPLEPIIPSVVVEGTAEINERLPRSFMLSNGRLSSMVTASGTGRIRWGEFELGRWEADPLINSGGQAIYINDLDSGEVWSPTFAPTLHHSSAYRIFSLPERLIFANANNDIETELEVMVTPDADLETRQLTIRNTSPDVASLEVSSLFEFSLAPHDAYATHPAFNRLFIGIEGLPEQDGVLAHRRLRSEDEQPIWVAHTLVNMTEPSSRAVIQTDRISYIGRSSNYRHPKGLGQAGTGQRSVDPIAALAQRVVIPAGGQVRLVSMTAVSSTREEALRIVNRYRQPDQLRRARNVAWTAAQAELQRLQVSQGDAETFHRLAAYLLYPGTRLLRQAGRSLVGGASSRGSVGLKLPSVVLIISDATHLSFLHQLHVAITYLSRRGVTADLGVIIQPSGDLGARFAEETTDLLERLDSLRLPEEQISWSILQLSELSQMDLSVILKRAAVTFNAADGSLAEQLADVPRLAQPDSDIEVPPLAFQPDGQSLHSWNGYGGFDEDGNYVIATGGRHLPAPWVNVIANRSFATVVTERGLGYTWSGNSQQGRITPWINDPVSDLSPEGWYIWEPDRRQFWSLMATSDEPNHVRVTHGAGFTAWQGARDGIGFEVQITVPQDGPAKRVKVNHLRLINHSHTTRELLVSALARLVLGEHAETDGTKVSLAWDSTTSSVLANTTNPELRDTVVYMALNRDPYDFTTDRGEVMAAGGSGLPYGLAQPSLSERVVSGSDPAAALRQSVVLSPGESAEITWFIGAANNYQQAVADLEYLRDRGGSGLLEDSRRWWESELSSLQVSTPDKNTDILINKWLPYQMLASRLWGRTGFYQSSGAFGFRDQLQDVMALAYTHPELMRTHILEAAQRQYLEGDVQHWWQPLSRHGLRSRISDDRLWLPVAVHHYITVTGDVGLLDVEIPFLQSPVLHEGELDRYELADLGPSGTILDHCQLAIDISLTRGSHDLPLIGTGDWCDGYNRVGVSGRGESVWLGWFTAKVLSDFAPLVRDKARASRYLKEAERLRQTIDQTEWDGRWYRRGYYDDGTPLGSMQNQEGKIDSLAQSWAVLADGTSSVRQWQAIDSSLERLVQSNHEIVTMLTPPFDRESEDPGYIKGYLPGVRENGGQYTHAAIWLVIACARLGRGDEAVRLLEYLSPIRHGRSQSVDRYMIEPYVVAGDVYSMEGSEGMGGWSWYTGSAAWMYRAWIEDILGIQIVHNRVQIFPSLPSNWPGFEIVLRRESAAVVIRVYNQAEGSGRVIRQAWDGNPVDNGPVDLSTSGHHKLEVWLG